MVELASGVYWLRLPLPFELDHVNVYLIRDSDGWMIVDTGLNTPETQAIWLQVISGLQSSGSLTRVLITHAHPDHVGLAGWLQMRVGAQVLMTEAEREVARRSQLPRNGTDRDDYWQRAGVPELMAAWARSRPEADLSPLPDSVDLLSDGDPLVVGGETWYVMIGRGHASEHACLYSPTRRLLISGDQMLPRMSPIVGVWEFSETSNPLQDWFRSLDGLEALPEDTLVLPAHDEPFVGVRTRARSLRDRHIRKLERLLDACRSEPRTTFSLARELYPRHLSHFQTVFACAETLAHLHFLKAAQQVEHGQTTERVDVWSALL